jgi:hypothetical protein
VAIPHTVGQICGWLARIAAKDALHRLGDGGPLHSA